MTRRPPLSRRGAGAALAVAALLAVPALAEAASGQARNGLTAAGEARAFEVFTRAGFGGADYFCAAGDFARVHLNAAPTDRVTVLRAAGPSETRPNRRSILFGLRPPGASENRGLSNVFATTARPGTSRSVAHAVALCRPGPPDE
jgi:hypothetical protein